MMIRIDDTTTACRRPPYSLRASVGSQAAVTTHYGNCSAKNNRLEQAAEKIHIAEAIPGAGQVKICADSQDKDRCEQAADDTHGIGHYCCDRQHRRRR